MKPMLTSANVTHRWAKASALALALYTTALCVALLSCVPRLRPLSVGDTTAASLGPLHLIDIVKRASPPDGFTLAFGAKVGLIYLGLLCIGLAIGVNLICRHYERQLRHRL